MRKYSLTLTIVAVLFLLVETWPAEAQFEAGQPAPAPSGVNITRDITFPVGGPSSFRNDFYDTRDNGTRIHQAIDIPAAKMTPIVSASDGYVVNINIPEASWGYALAVRDYNGYTYSYLHINNDTPGTDDGLGGVEHAYAPGINRGARVTRGQLLGWVGDSGNAEATIPHLHFEMRDPNRNVINPYDSLVLAAAQSPYSAQIRVGSSPTVSHGVVPDLSITIDQSYIFTTTLTVGSTGDAVNHLQNLLKFLGYFTVNVTGYFGSITKAALINFQKDYGLPQTGVVDLATRTRFNEDGFTLGSSQSSTVQPPAPPPAYGTQSFLFVRTLSLGSTGEDVRQLQIRLKLWGYYRYSVITGYYGPITRLAVMDLQSANGLPTTGIVDERTRANLNH